MPVARHPSLSLRPQETLVELYFAGFGKSGE